MRINSKSGRIFDLPDDKEDAQINAGILEDSDTYELSETEFANLKPVKMSRPTTKNTETSVNIRLSPEVLEYFKATGNGWQNRMDQVLKDYVAHQ